MNRITSTSQPAYARCARALVVLLAAACLTPLVPVNSFGAEWGDLSGTFIYDGEAPPATKVPITKDQELCGKFNLMNESLVIGPAGGIANIVVYLRTKNVAVHPSYEADAKAKVQLNNKNCRFEPHMVAMRLTQTLDIRNSDPVTHNSNVSPLGDAAINPLLAVNGNVEHQFKKSQAIPIAVSCSIHPWMTAWVIPRDNPYAAVTDNAGTFRIKNIPAGEELEFQVWQERAGYLIAKPEWKLGRFKLAIKPGKKDLGMIKVALPLFK